MRVADNIPYAHAKAAVDEGLLLMMVDRALATQAYKNSGEAGVNLATLMLAAIIAAIPLLFVWWPLSIGSLTVAYLSFKLLRFLAISWVRKNAFSSEGLYQAFDKHRVIWFTWPS